MMACTHVDENSEVKEICHHEQLVSCSAESLRFLIGIGNRDLEARRQAMEFICKTLDGWFEGYGSPPANYRNSTLKSAVDLKQLIVEQLPDILRLSIDCPFADVRESCTFILQDLLVSLFYSLICLCTVFESVTLELLVCCK